MSVENNPTINILKPGISQESKRKP